MLYRFALVTMLTAGLTYAPTAHTLPPQQDWNTVQGWQHVANELIQQGKYEEACQLLKRLLQEGGEIFCNQEQYAETLFLLAIAESKAGRIEASQKLLTRLLQEELSKELHAAVVQFYARALEQLHQPEKAFLILWNLSQKIPAEYWKAKERAFFALLQRTLNESYQNRLLQAERLIENKCAAEALTLYEEVLAAVEQGCYPAALLAEQSEAVAYKLKYRLAECHFYLGQTSQTLALLESVANSPPTGLEAHQLYAKALYLLAQVYQELEQPDKAVPLLETYLSLIPPSKQRDHATFEAAKCFYLLNDLLAAQRYFQTVATSPTNTLPSLRQLANLYLARIALYQNQYAEAAPLLEQLSREIMPADSLHYELAYLLGKCRLHEEQFPEAVKLFEAALAYPHTPPPEWSGAALYELGTCYSQLAQAALAPSEKALYYTCAEQSFRRLIEQNPTASAYLALAHLLIAQFHALHDPAARDKAAQLLAEKSFESLENQAEALLMQAEISEPFERREAFYQQVLQPLFQETATYRLSWQLRGLNALQQAEKLKSLSAEKALPLFALAEECFEKAFALCDPKEPQQALDALKLRIQTCCAISSLEALSRAFHLLDHLLYIDKKLVHDPSTKTELFYLYGLVAAQLYHLENHPRFREIAEEALTRALSDLSSLQAQTALHALATLCYRHGEFAKAQAYYETLTLQFPESPLAGDSWFWMAQCEQQRNQAPEKIKAYLQNSFTLYPTAAYAAEAYFRYYALSDYLRSAPAAIQHLQEMAEKFPNAPFLIPAYYLLGLHFKKSVLDNQLHQENLLEAIQAFDRTVQLFEHLPATLLSSHEMSDYFCMLRFRALLEAAFCKLSKAIDAESTAKQLYFEGAEANFQRILTDLAQPEEWPAFSKKPSELFQLLDEAQYGLAQVYLKQQHDRAAEETLSALIERYRQSNFDQGYYLSRAWSQQGYLAAQQHDWPRALSAFQNAEIAGANQSLTGAQKLDLWFQQSLAYRQLGELNQAMLLLSQIINENVASSLRIQAMYQRAEIYELQGRKELAAKQLEAICLKGGEWAAKAQAKLNTHYCQR